MEGSKKLVNLAVCLTSVCFVLVLGDTSAHPRANFKGTQYEKRKIEHLALESSPVSEVDYVDGPLAPLYDFLIQHRLHKFCKLLRDAALEQVIKDLGDSWTLFAPTDASFIFLPGGTLEEIQKNPSLLQNFILYHFIAGDFPSSQIESEMMIDSAQGSPLRFNIYGQTMTVSGAEILQPDLLFEMGRVYIIDHPLYPIPTEDTLSNLQKNYKEMYKLLVDAGLADYLSSGTFTILVPDDQAFDYLSGELKDALATNVSLTERILLTHILPGSVYIAAITDGMQLETVGGTFITFTVKRGLTFANGIPIVLPDVPLTNGVIHVINRVLLPEGIDADCQCKPTSEANKTPEQPPGDSRPSFVQPQRPPFRQIATTRRPGQPSSLQTPSPVQGQTHGSSRVPEFPGTPGSHTSPGQRGYPVRPQSPSTSPVNRPWSPSRSGQTARPLPPPNQVTRSPYPPEPLSDDDINSVIETGAQPRAGQRKPELTRTTRYPPPPPPRQKITPRPTQIVSSHTTRKNQDSIYPSSENENYSDQEVTTRVPHTTRQVDSWSNRRPTPAPRYPVPQRGSYNTPTTRRSQTTRIYDWNQPRFTQPSIEQPDQGVEIDSLNQDQGLQTQRPGTQTTNWQQRKQEQQTTRQPAQRNTFQTTPRQPRPPPPRITTPRSQWQRPTISTQIPPSEPNQQQPNCRRPSDRITTLTKNLPICSESVTNECQNPPYNPSDSRPLCSEPEKQGCPDPNDPFDSRPLCPSSAVSDGCRQAGQPTYIGDRRPLCSQTSVSQTGCKEASAPYNPFDRRPVCGQENVPEIIPMDRQEESSAQGCRRREEVQNPQDLRPLCPEENVQDCRPLLERPKPGDRRPICKTSQSNQTPKPIKDVDKPPKKLEKPQQQTTHAQRGRYPTQTTRRQSWQSTTRAPQSWQTTRQPVGKQPQSGTKQNRPQVENESVHTQPQPGSRPSQPQTGHDIQPEIEADFKPQTDPSRPESEVHSSQPQSGRYPSQQQSGRYPSQQQTGRNPSQPHSGVRTTQPQRGSYPSQPSVGSYPPQRQPTYPSTPNVPQSGSYPNQPTSNLRPSQPQSASYPSQQPGSPASGVDPRQPHRPGNPLSQPNSVVDLSRPQISSQRPTQPGRSPSGYPQRQPSYPPSQSGHSQTQGTSPPGSPGSRPSQPFIPPGRLGTGQGSQTGSLAPNNQLTTTTRRPISVTGTSTTPGEDSRRTLYEIVEDPALLIRGRPVHLTKIFELFHKAGIEDILNGPGPMTVFLPSDDAFSWLPKGAVEQLEENPDLLRQVLLYHIAQSEILPSGQEESYSVPSLEGNQLLITMLNGGKLILISGAKAVAVTRASNGIFYVINQLLYPLPQQDIVTAIQSRPDLTTLAYLLPLSGLEDMLQGQTPFTLLAPTDTAFAQLPQLVYDELTRNTTALQEILLNHIIDGAHYGREFFTGGTFPSARGGKLKFQVVSYGYQVNEVNIKTPEIVTGTGVIHLIDQVLLETPDLVFITNIENSVTDGDVSITNPEQPIDSPQPNQGQVTGRRPVTDERFTAQRPGINQPQLGGPSVGQPSPVGRVPIAAQRISSNQPSSTGRPHGASIGGQHQPIHGQQPGQSPGSTFGGRQPSIQHIRQPIQGQQTPGQPIGSTFGGRSPSAQGVRQPIQGQFQPPRAPLTQPGQQSHSQQNLGQPGYSPPGGQRIPSQGQRTQTNAFTGQRQPVTQTGDHGRNQGHGSTSQTDGQTNNVADLARSMGLNQFANWVTNTGLLEKIHDGGVYTVFAPTDDAVSTLPQDMVYSIDSDPEKVKPILEYHIVPQRLNLNSVTNEETASTLLKGKSIRFNVYKNSQPNCQQLVTASGTPVGEPLATMGSIQVIPVTQVLYQPSGNLQKIIEASPVLQRLNEAIKSARLTWMLSGTGPMTIFAPSDTAFDSMTQDEKKSLVDNKQAFTDLLKRHIVRGTFFSSGIQDDLEKNSENNKPLKLSLQEGILTVNSVPVTYSDITATNGVLHVIDQFL